MAIDERVARLEADMVNQKAEQIRLRDAVHKHAGLLMGVESEADRIEELEATVFGKGTNIGLNQRVIFLMWAIGVVGGLVFLVSGAYIQAWVQKHVGA